MTDIDEAALKQTLEPAPWEVERVVGSALTARSGRGGGRIRSFAVGIGALALGVAAFYLGSKRPPAPPAPLASAAQVELRVSNCGEVLLVEGLEGRTLVASVGNPREGETGRTPYRVMIWKGTAQ